MRKIKSMLSILLVAVMLLSVIPMGMLTADAAVTLADLKAKYPHGKYWNGGNANTYTSTPCSHHGNCSYTGGCYCNNFKGHAIQCMGFAYQLASLVYGGDPYADWTPNRSTSALDSLKAGDVVRYQNDGHSIFVTGVSGSTVTYADCNSDGHCIIRWDQTISKSTIKSTFTYVDSAPSAWVSVNVTHKVDSAYSTSFVAYPKAKITAENIFDANHNQISSTSWIGTSDKCTIHEVYTDGCCKVTYPLDDGGTKTVYSKISLFSKPTLSVYYHANGGKVGSDYMLSNYIICYSDGSKRVQTWTYNTAKTDGLVNAATFGLTKTGYTFKGWGTKTTGGTIFDQNDTGLLPSEINSNLKNGNSSTTLYAYWVPNTLTVTFHANGGSVTSDTYSIKNGMLYVDAEKRNSHQLWTYNSAKSNGLMNASTYGLKKPGYTFKGWGTKTTGGTIFDQNDTGLLPTEINSNLKNGNCSTTLYAIWIPNELQVIYHANGGTISSTKYMVNNNLVSNKTSGAALKHKWEYNTAQADGLWNAETFGLTRMGYTFKGWGTTTSGGTVFNQDNNALRPLEINSNLSKGNCSTTLYAIWSPNQYTVQYNSNGGTGAPGNQTKIYGTTLKLSSTIPKRTGYIFKGWATDSTATTANYQSGGDYTTNASCTLYAVWQPETYTIQYSANGGTNAPDNQTKTYGATLKLSTTIPRKEGYIFKGWSTDSSATTANYQAGGNYTANAACTLYAVWQPETYTIQYNANGGTGAPGNQTKTYGTTLKLSTTIPKKTGHIFKGWSTGSAATTVNYQAGGNYTANAACTLYAVWQPETYTIQYNANGGTGAPGSQTKTYGATLKLNTTIPQKEGYIFKGWSTDSSATTAHYQAGGNYTANAACTLYAVWEKIPEITVEILIGDVDGDLSVSANDALMVLKCVVGKIRLSETQLAVAELTDDTAITASDALQILKIVVGKA